MTAHDRTTSPVLAINGGSPVRTTPFPPRAQTTSADRAAVDRLFERAIAEGTTIGYGGPEEDAYCAEFAQLLGGGYADGVSSGSAGVYVALRALELEPYTEVIVGAVNDPGGIMPIPLSNCIPVIADTAPGSYNTGPEQVAACVTDLTRAIVLPHIAGEPADAAGIRALADRLGVPLIEDCAQAHGARFAGRPVGTFGELATFSTMHLKHHHTGGQGGVVFTRDPLTYQRVRQYADRGKPFGPLTGGTNAVASLNLNIDELHAAIGRVQLTGLPANVSTRRWVAARLGAQVAEATCAAVCMPPQLPGAEPSYWFLRLRFHPDRIGCTKDEFCAALAAEGIPLLSQPFLPHTFEWFTRRRVFGTGGHPWTSPEYRGDPDRAFPCPNAHQAVADHFSLRVSGGWRAREVDDTLDAIRKVARAYGAA